MRLFFLVALVACSRTPAGLIAPTSTEMTAAAAWVDANWGPDSAQPPIAFKYGGTASPGGFTTSYSVRALDGHRTERTRTFADPATGLTVTAVVVVYDDYPAVEWTLTFANG